MEIDAMTVNVKRIVLAVTPVLAVAAAMPVFGEAAIEHRNPSQTQQQDQAITEKRASDIIGADV
jgi:hypothetical protein